MGKNITYLPNFYQSSIMGKKEIENENPYFSGFVTMFS